MSTIHIELCDGNMYQVKREYGLRKQPEPGFKQAAYCMNIGFRIELDFFARIEPCLIPLYLQYIAVYSKDALRPQGCVEVICIN